MGNTQNKEKTPKQITLEKKSIKERQATRYAVAESSAKQGSVQASIDKYDYLIVFSTSSSSHLSSSIDEIELGSIGSVDKPVNWTKAESLWKGIVPGTEELKKRSVEGLYKVWRKFGNDNKSESAWRAIIKEAIIDQLTSKAGLQVHKTSIGSYVFCRIRAPLKLLELQARKEGYRLQFRGEIDPGSEMFWNTTDDGLLAPELDEDRRLLSKEEANLILGKLHRAGKISAMDMHVNPLKETQRIWSRRVHALERIADRVPIWNKYPAYAPFTSETHFRYLFQTYPSVRGKTLLRSKDRLYLTKAIIDRYFDMGLLVEEGLVESFMALHDANRGESLTNEVLQKRWSTFWRVSAKEVGSPLVTDEAYDEDKAVSWYLRPFSQPLANIREYMGEKVALHFAWLGCYTYDMMVPATVGAAFSIYQYVVGYSESQEGINVFQVLFLVFMVIWCVTYKEHWKQQQRAIALKWGTHGFEAAEKDRPQFRGDPEKPFIRSFVSNRRITFFPEEKRFHRQMISLVVVGASVCVLVGIVAAVYYLDYFLTVKSGYQWGTYLCSLISAIQINVLSYIYGDVSRALNDWENHRTQTAYEDSLTSKIFLFEIFNSFAALSYICFFRGNIFRACTNNDCISDLKKQLLIIYALRFFLHFVTLFVPTVKEYLYTWTRTRVLLEWMGQQPRVVVNKGNLDQLYLSEFNRLPDDGTYVKYAEVVLQYGYLIFFGSAWPLIFVLSLLDNLLLIRVNAWKQCAVMRRPDVYLAEDVGMWTDIMDAMTVLGVYYNVAIFVWTGRSVENFSVTNKLLFALVASQVLLMCKFSWKGVLSGVPEWIRVIAARQQYIISKHLHGIDDNEDIISHDKAVAGLSVLPEDAVDVDGKTLYDFREKKMTRLESRQSEELERRRRVLQVDLQEAKHGLDLVKEGERFNADTQMGETLDGHPLGLVNLTIKKITNIDPNINAEFLQLEVCIDDDGARAYDRNFIAITKNFDAPRHGKDNVEEINQTFGPFTPVTTRSAQILFHLRRADKDLEILQNGRVSLQDLNEQEPKDLIVQLYDVKKTGDNREQNKFSPASIVHMQITFLFSKILLHRSRLRRIKNELNDVEKQLSYLKLGTAKTEREESK